nr:MAG TPA: hypothetical protein [Caudoviricetes sp.]
MCQNILISVISSYGFITNIIQVIILKHKLVIKWQIHNGIT